MACSAGHTYWRRRLAPLAAQGFRRGWLDRRAVVLVADDGRRAALLRPLDGWVAAYEAVHDAEASDVLGAERRYDLAQGARALLHALQRIGEEEDA